MESEESCCSLCHWEDPTRTGVFYALCTLYGFYAVWMGDLLPASFIGGFLIVGLLLFKVGCTFGLVPEDENGAVLPAGKIQSLFPKLYTGINQTIGKFHKKAGSKSIMTLALTLLGVITLADIFGTPFIVFLGIQGCFLSGAAKKFAGINVKEMAKRYIDLAEDKVEGVIALIPKAKSVSKQD